MSDKLQLDLIQADLAWENKSENLKKFETIISKISNSDLIILPEMFTTGFSNNSEVLCEPMDGPTVEWMKKISSSSKAAICGSVIIEENSKIYNRFLFVQPNGRISHYNKKHLFAMAGEHKYFSGGSEQMVIEYKSWKICPMICYDLRFPVWSRRNENTFNYDLLIYVANWPKARVNAWSSLLGARAIENMSYCTGVNRVGIDENNLEYTGASVVLDPLGKTVGAATLSKEEHLTVTIDKEILKKCRTKLPFQSDADSFVFN